MSRHFLSVLVLLSLLTPARGSAQSLQEAAAREAARRQQAKGSRTYTNRDLPKPTPVAKDEAAETAPASAPDNPSPEPSRSEKRTPAPEPKGPPVRTEQQWRQAAEASRQAVAAARARVKVAEEKQAGTSQALGAATALAHQGHPEALFVVLEESKEVAKEAEEAQAALAAAEAALESLVAEATDSAIPDSWWAEPKSS
jgi:hypothetical protein